MIRPCNENDFQSLYDIINDAAQAYKGVIPEDRWHEPYMAAHALRREIRAGVAFHGYERDGLLAGVMGIQPVRDVTLIRHAYVRTHLRRAGIGGALLARLLPLAASPVLIGTWAAADWAVHFYEKHGFTLVSPGEKSRLLKTYWDIPERQVETSVVLAQSAHVRNGVFTPGADGEKAPGAEDIKAPPAARGTL